jgi:hypothetical protein
MKRLFVAAAFTLVAALPQTVAAQTCTYVVTPSGPTVVGFKVTIGTIAVTTAAGCSWTAQNSALDSRFHVDDGFVSNRPLGLITGSGTFRWFNETSYELTARHGGIEVLPGQQQLIAIPILQRAGRSPVMDNAFETGFLTRDLAGGALHVQNMKTDGGCANCRNAPRTPWGVDSRTSVEGSDPHPGWSLGPVSLMADPLHVTRAGYYRRDPATGQNVIDIPYLDPGTAAVTKVNTIPLPWLSNTDYYMAAVGNFNGDFFPDLVWRNAATGQVLLWLLDRGSVSGPWLPTVGTILELPSLPSNFVIGGAYDFNSDGIDDILWRNTSNGNNAVWLMSSTGFSSIVNLPGLPLPAYYVGALDDFDNDGQPDILWRNDATGQLATWKMNNTTFVRIVDLDPLVGVSVLGPH